MKMKKILAGLLAVAVIGSTVSYNNYIVPKNAAITASAEETEEYTEGTYESLTYKKYSDHIEISDCDESVTEVVIPDEIEGLPVTSIGYRAFYNCKSLTKITIPDNVTSIGDHTFLYCISLTEINIPDSVTSIGFNAFNHCESLTEITIPESVTIIRFNSFFDCTGLMGINVSENNENYISKDGVLFNHAMTELICYPARKIETKYSIPDSVTIINNNAFQNCTSLTEIIISDNVKDIRSYAFNYCKNLTSITIPDSVTSIGAWAFLSCTSLESITIENPECEIYDSEYTIANGYDENDNLYFNGTIYGYENSTAQAYAEKYVYNFALIEDSPEQTTETTTTTTTTETTTTTTTTPDITTELKLGDVNGDNTIDSLDASLTLADYVAFSSASAHNFTEKQLKAADVNLDGIINALDASNMLAYYVYTSSGGTDSIEVFLGIE